MGLQLTAFIHFLRFRRQFKHPVLVLLLFVVDLVRFRDTGPFSSLTSSSPPMADMIPTMK